MDEPEPAAAAAAEVTQLLQRAATGDRAAADRAFSLLYDELRRQARRRLWQSGEVSALDTTGLVHEVYLRLQAGAPRDFPDRRHFLSYAARAMRGVVVDAIRARQAQRRGGEFERVTLGTCVLESVAVADDAEVLRVHESLDALAEVDERLARVVELRYFCGMTEAEVAACLEVTERTVRRDWQKARLILLTSLA